MQVIVPIHWIKGVLPRLRHGMTEVASYRCLQVGMLLHVEYNKATVHEVLKLMLSVTWTS